MNIRQYIAREGLTLGEFAARVGVSAAAMGRYAARKRTPRPRILRHIVEASGGAIEPNDLFAGALAPHLAAAPQAGLAAGSIDLIISDLNGTLRGKRLPAAMIDKALGGEVRLPGSTFAGDVTGESVPGTGFLWEIGNAYEAVPPSLPTRWLDAIERFERSAVMRDYLGADYCALYATVKRYVLAKFEARVTPLEFEWYLNTV